MDLPVEIIECILYLLDDISITTYGQCCKSTHHHIQRYNPRCDFKTALTLGKWRSIPQLFQQYIDNVQICKEHNTNVNKLYTKKYGKTWSLSNNEFALYMDKELMTSKVLASACKYKLMYYIDMYMRDEYYLHHVHLYMDEFDDILVVLLQEGEKKIIHKILKYFIHIKETQEFVSSSLYLPNFIFNVLKHNIQEFINYFNEYELSCAFTHSIKLKKHNAVNIFVDKYINLKDRNNIDNVIEMLDFNYIQGVLNTVISTYEHTYEYERILYCSFVNPDPRVTELILHEIEQRKIDIVNMDLLKVFQKCRDKNPIDLSEEDQNTIRNIDCEDKYSLLYNMCDGRDTLRLINMYTPFCKDVVLMKCIQHNYIDDIRDIDFDRINNIVITQRLHDGINDCGLDCDNDEIVLYIWNMLSTQAKKTLCQYAICTFNQVIMSEAKDIHLNTIEFIDKKHRDIHKLVLEIEDWEMDIQNKVRIYNNIHELLN